MLCLPRPAAFDGVPVVLAGLLPTCFCPSGHRGDVSEGSCRSRVRGRGIPAQGA